jgi:hypothetical protein
LFYFLNKQVIEKRTGKKDIEALCKELDGNFGCLHEKEENAFQKKIFEIYDVKSFSKYYPLLGIALPNDEALQNRLKQAIENSRKKGYHGSDQDMNELPKPEVQALELLEKDFKPFQYYDNDKSEWTEAPDSPKWKEAVLAKFNWIKQINSNSAPGEELAPRDYALMSDDEKIEQKDFLNIKTKNDPLKRHL